MLTSHVVSKCISNLKNDLAIIQRKKSRPKDLGASRKTFNDESIKRALFEVMNNWGNLFHPRDSLVNLCSGLESSPQVQQDLLNAEEIGEKALQTFIDDRISSSSTPFYDPIKKLRLRTFRDMNAKKTIKINDKSVTIAAERSLFGSLLVLAKNREGLTLKEILHYSLSPIPWCFGLPDGTILKTVKSKLLRKSFKFAFNIFLKSVANKKQK